MISNFNFAKDLLIRTSATNKRIETEPLNKQAVVVQIITQFYKERNSESLCTKSASLIFLCQMKWFPTIYSQNNTALFLRPANSTSAQPLSSTKVVTDPLFNKLACASHCWKLLIEIRKLSSL